MKLVKLNLQRPFYTFLQKEKKEVREREREFFFLKRAPNYVSFRSHKSFRCLCQQCPLHHHRHTHKTLLLLGDKPSRTFQLISPPVFLDHARGHCEFYSKIGINLFVSTLGQGPGRTSYASLTSQGFPTILLVADSGNPGVVFCLGLCPSLHPNLSGLPQKPLSEPAFPSALRHHRRATIISCLVSARAS